MAGERENRSGRQPEKPHWKKAELTNEYGRRLSKTRKQWACDGCGRIIPIGSWVMIWQVWRTEKTVCKGGGNRNRKYKRFNYRTRLRFCSDCQDIIYGCPDRPVMNPMPDPPMVRSMCGGCPQMPFCDRIGYLEKSEPGDVFFGDLAGNYGNGDRVGVPLGTVDEQRDELVRLKREGRWDGAAGPCVLE